MADRIIYDLGVDVLRRTEHRKTRPMVCCPAQLASDPLPATKEESFRFLGHQTLLLFPFLPANTLIGVFNAFAFVRFGWPIGTDVGRDLTDALTVGSADGDGGRPLATDPDVAGDEEPDIMTIAELEI